MQVFDETSHLLVSHWSKQVIWWRPESEGVGAKELHGKGKIQGEEKNWATLAVCHIMSATTCHHHGPRNERP